MRLSRKINAGERSVCTLGPAIRACNRAAPGDRARGPPFPPLRSGRGLVRPLLYANPHQQLLYPDLQEDAFAWSDPSLPGSRLDPQTTDFARRAAELWTQAAGLREFAADNDATSGNGPAEGGGTEFLAGALEQVRTSKTQPRTLKASSAKDGPASCKARIVGKQAGSVKRPPRSLPQRRARGHIIGSDEQEVPQKKTATIALLLGRNVRRRR